MIKSVRALAIAISLATISAATGYLVARSWIGALLSLLWGGLWVSGMLRQTRKNLPDEDEGDRKTHAPVISNEVASTALLGYVLLVIAGVWFGVWPGWLLVGLSAALAGWDLDYFVSRLRLVRDEQVIASLTHAHLRRLGWVMAGSLLLGSLALVLHFQLNFGWAVLVSLLVVWSLSRFIGMFRHTRGE